MGVQLSVSFCLFKVPHDTTLMISALKECSSFWGYFVFTDALSQWPGAIFLFLEALANPSVMRVRLHHSQGNFHWSVWAWRRGGSGKPVSISHRCFTCIQPPLAQRERIVVAIIQVILFKKNIPVLNFPVTEEGEFGCEWAKISDSMTECDAQDIYLLLSSAHIVLCHRKGTRIERTWEGSSRSTAPQNL